jgi:hypothetical protein
VKVSEVVLDILVVKALKATKEIKAILVIKVVLATPDLQVT